MTKEFRGFRAVDSVDLDVGRGQRTRPGRPERRRQDHAVQPALGLLTPTSGTDVPRAERSRAAAREIRHLGLARSFQITSLFDKLTALEHLELALASPTGLGWRFWRSDRALPASPGAPDLLDQVGMADHADIPVG